MIYFEYNGIIFRYAIMIVDADEEFGIAFSTNNITVTILANFLHSMKAPTDNFTEQFTIPAPSLYVVVIRKWSKCKAFE